jgi:hypothetical protein
MGEKSQVLPGDILVKAKKERNLYVAQDLPLFCEVSEAGSSVNNT